MINNIPIAPAPTRRAVIDIGRKCNAKCVFCYYAHSSDQNSLYPKEKLRADIDDAISRGNNYIDFTGGEPTLHPDLPELIAYAKSKDVLSCVITNGLATESCTQKIMDAGVDDFLISVHGMDSHDALVGVKNARKKQTRFLDQVCKELQVRFNYVVTSKNQKEIVLAAQFLTQFKPLIVNFINFNPHHGWEKDESGTKEMVADLRAARSDISAAIAILEKNRISVNLRYFPMCTIEPEYWRCVCNDLHVAFDPYEWDYNITPKTQSAFESWAINLSSNNELKSHPCMVCDIRMQCGGVNKNFFAANPSCAEKVVLSEDDKAQLTRNAADAYYYAYRQFNSSILQRYTKQLVCPPESTGFSQEEQPEINLKHYNLPEDFGPKHPDWKVPSKQNRYRLLMAGVYGGSRPGEKERSVEKIQDLLTGPMKVSVSQRNRQYPFKTHAGKTCIFTIVSGEYQWYIPIFIYCAKRAYPDYDVRVYVREDVTVSKEWADMVFPLKGGYPNDGYTTAALRFVYSDEALEQYDFLLITDIDMLIMGEPITIVSQHMRFIEMHKLECYDNYISCWSGLVPRVPGVHFITKEWWTRTKDARKRYENELRACGSRSWEWDELMIGAIIQESGLPMPPEELHLWAHHGVHLGDYRRRIKNNMSGWGINEGAQASFILKLLQDPIFIQLLEEATRHLPELKKIFTCFKEITCA